MSTPRLALVALSFTLIAAPASVLAYDDAALSRSKRLTTFERAYDKGFRDASGSTEASPAAAKAAPNAGAAAGVSPDAGQAVAQITPTIAPASPARSYAGEGDPGLGPIVYLGAKTDAQVEPNMAVVATEEAVRNITDSEAKLSQAQQALEESLRLQQEAVQQAQAELELAKTKATAQLEAQRVDPMVVKNTIVSGHFEGMTLREIAGALLPEGWTVRVHGPDDALDARRFEYVADNIARERAIYELTSPIGLRVKYFFGLTDAEGRSTPLLLIYDPRASLSKGS